MSPYTIMDQHKESTTLCSELTNNTELKPDWEEAFENCKNYRDYLESSNINPALRITSYLLKREDFDDLLSQNHGDLDGVRIYIGHEDVGEEQYAVRLFAVACKKNEDNMYEDWQIPKKGDKEFFTKLGEVRPCPNECSGKNSMNSDPAPEE